MTEIEKMQSGQLYAPGDEQITYLRNRSARLTHEYNKLPESEIEKRKAILKDLMGEIGESSFIRGPMHFDYGKFTKIGEHVFANYNFTVLDCGPVTIGDEVLFGPNCTLAAALHPYLAEERRIMTKKDGATGHFEYSAPITIEDGCWIGAGVTVCAGVTIGRGSIIGAGSVVTHDIPPNALAAGNPCRVIREITEDDRMGLSH